MFRKGVGAQIRACLTTHLSLDGYDGHFFPQGINTLQYKLYV